MKVKIISAAYSTYWYADRIGEVFEVKGNDSGFGFSVTSGDYPQGACIQKADCIEVQDEPQDKPQAPLYVKILSNIDVESTGWYKDKAGQVFLVDQDEKWGKAVHQDMYITLRAPFPSEDGPQAGGIFKCNAEVFPTPLQNGRFQFKVQPEHAQYSKTYDGWVGEILWCTVTEDPEYYKVSAFKNLPKSMVTPFEEPSAKVKENPFARYVKVISCEDPDFWYSDKIGHTFDIIGTEGTDVMVRTNDPDVFFSENYISACDVIFVDANSNPIGADAYATVPDRAAAPATKEVHSSGITFEMMQESTYRTAARGLSDASLAIYGAVRVEFYKKNGDLRVATGYLTPGSTDDFVTIKEIGVGYRSFNKELLLKVQGEKVLMEVQK